MISRSREPSFARNQDGITAVEFALIAPVFLVMLMGIVEFSLIMFASVALESATNNTARLGKTGYVPPGLTRSEAIIANVKDKTSGLLDPDKITISQKAYSNFDKIGESEPCLQPASPPCAGTAGVNFVDINGNDTWDSDMGLAGLGNPGDVVVYTVSYPWSITTPIISAITGTIFTINARTVVRNEPFNTN